MKELELKIVRKGLRIRIDGFVEIYVFGKISQEVKTCLTKL